MRAIDIMLKDLLQIGRDFKMVLFLFLMPLVFTIFMGFAYKGAANPVDPREVIGWVNQDPAGVSSLALADLLSASENFNLRSFDLSESGIAIQQVASGELAAALLIPENFSSLAQSSKAPQLKLFIAQNNPNQQTILEMVLVPVTRLMSSIEIGRLHLAGLASSNVKVEIESAISKATSLWIDTLTTGPQIVVEQVQGGSSQPFDLHGNPYNQTSPGILVQFAIFSLINSASILVEERKSRTLNRMLTTATSRASIISGHWLAMFILVFILEVLLVIFGQTILRVNYLHEPVGTFMVMISLAAWTAAMGLLIGVFAKRDEQALLFSLIAMFIFSGIGGAWFPLETTGKAFAAIGKLTPGAWAMTGFQNILIRGLGTPSVILPTAALLGYAIFFFGCAVWLFRSHESG